MLEEDEKCDDVKKIWERVMEGHLKAANEVCGSRKGQSRYQRKQLFKHSCRRKKFREQLNMEEGKRYVVRIEKKTVGNGKAGCSLSELFVR